MTTDKPDLYSVLDHYGWQPPAEHPGWRSVRCLVHDERHASCRVNYDLQVIRCMACGFKGDSYNVIMHHEGVNFADAKRIGAQLFGAGDSSIRSGHTSSGAVSSGSRHTTGNRAYIPPRLRNRSERAAG